MTTNPTPPAEAEQPLPPPSGDPVVPAAPAAAVAPGTNALAIAALVCGLLGFTFVAAVLAIVFGIVALRQLKRRPQSGRGLAIAGIVLGAVSVVVWLVVVVALGSWFAERSEDGEVTSAGIVLIDDLREGDCFDGAEDGESVSLVRARPCAEPHEGQVAAIVDLPAGPFPGLDEAAGMAEQACMEIADPRVKDEVYESVEFLTLSPESEQAWELSRTGLCVLTAPAGQTLTGTALKG